MRINRKLLKLLSQEELDSDSIIENIKIGIQWKFFGIKIGTVRPVGLFCTTDDTQDTVFSLLAKKGILSSVLPTLFNNANSIIAREQKVTVNSVDDIIDNFLLTPLDNNPLYHAIKVVDYEAWAQIAEYGFVTKLVELVKQVDFEKTDVVDLTVFSLDKDYPKLFYSLSAILQQPKHLGYIKDVLNRIKEEKYDLNENNTLKLAPLFNRAWSDILENDKNMEPEVYNKILLAVSTAEACDSQLKIQSQFTCGVKDYFLNDLFQQYFKNSVDYPFELSNINTVFSKVNYTLHTSRHIIASNLVVNMTQSDSIVDNAKNTNLLTVIGFSLFTFLCGLIVGRMFPVTNCKEKDSYPEDRDFFLPKKLSLNNCDQFFETLVVKKKFLPEEKTEIYKIVHDFKNTYNHNNLDKFAKMFNACYTGIRELQTEHEHECRQRKLVLKQVTKILGIGMDIPKSQSSVAGSVSSTNFENTAHESNESTHLLGLIEENVETA